ncbi:hypothetical protein CDD83_7602 [Cordyceps sp. RAO-2017]|nr:hypothetical protein CDD83_7602 [Cordyceps sp. RAO-2017]
MDGLLEPVAAPDQETGSLISDIGPKVGRIALFEVSVVIDDHSGAHVEFLFNRHSAHRDRIAAWVHNFEHSVLEAVGRLRVMPPQLTLADAPLLETSYDALSRLAADRLARVTLDGVANVETICPVSPVQQDILLAQARDQACFHLSATYELVTSGWPCPVDQSRLCEAWATLVARHDALRSVFIDSVSERGLFDKVVLRKISPDMLFLDSPDPVQTLATIPPIKSELERPRHRLAVCRSSTSTYIRLDASQAICDPASIHLLVSQLQRVYAGAAVDLAESAPPKRHRHISSQDSSHRLERWGADPAQAKPCLFPRLAFQQADRRLLTRSLDLAVGPADVYQFCRDHCLDASALVGLAWALVLHTFVGGANVSFGYQFPGREPEASRKPPQGIGCFAPLIPCLVDVSGAQTIAEALQAIQARAGDAARTESPTVAEVEHAVGLAGEALFNTCVSFHDTTHVLGGGGRRAEFASLAWDPAFVASSLDADCDLSLCVNVVGDRLRADITCRYLTADQAHNVVNSFERALQLVLAAPAARVSDIDLFTERDYQQITTPDWDPDQTDTKVSACLHQLVFERARLRPHALAVAAWDGDLSYEQVEAVVTKLATHLVNLGVGPGTLVPLVLDKCRWSPVVMLAVLKAGGCFVALDGQDLALARTTIEQLAPPLVLVTELAWKRLGPVAGSCVLVSQDALDALPPQLTFLPHEPVPEHAACAFVSPASPRPKGIFFTHQSLCSVLSAQGPALKINERSRVLQLSAFNVDVALVEIFGTLLHGGCVCVPSEVERIDDLEGVIGRMDITWSYMTPVLSRRIDPSRVPSLDTICFRTRSLDKDMYGPWLRNRNVLLAYGAPNVCPLAISVLQMSGREETGVIGPPLMGRFLVLHPKDPKRMVPVGAVGELAIDSPLVTPHRFTPGQPLVDPAYQREPPARPKWRYLRTGHVARLLDRGHVRLFASRRDETVKEGVHITEIERRIRLCLARGVDVAVEDITTSDSRQLRAAFLDLGRGPSRGPYDLNCLGPEVKRKLFAAKTAVEASLSKPSAAGERLPWRCIPAVFIPVRGLPLSVSLKVNRRRLRKNAASMSYAQVMGLADGQYAAGTRPSRCVDKPLPLTKAEESMRLIWAGVLGKAATGIGPSESFFDAGGSHLLAARLIVACRQGGFDVLARQVVAGETLTEMCRASSAVDAAAAADDDDDDGVRGGRSSPRGPSEEGRARDHGPYEGLVKLVLAPQIGVERHDVLDAAEATSQQVRSLESSLYSPRGDVNFLMLDFNGPVRAERLEAACEALTMTHPILRTAFAIHECRAYQVAIASFRARFWHRSCAAHDIDGEAEQAMQQDQRLPLQLGRPVTEFTYLEATSGRQGRLLIRCSSAQVTEGSAPQLVQDLIRLYRDPGGVPPRPSFLQYSRAVQSAARRLDSVRHWRARLAGARMTQIVPQSRPRGPVVDRAALHRTIDVPPLCDTGMGFDVVLKTAWAMVLARLAGRADVVFGELVEGHRRANHHGAYADLPSMVGPLESVVPVRVRLPTWSVSPLQMMQLVQHECASSLAHEGLGVRAIVRACTDWPDWTQFSTLVRHRSLAPVDGSVTLNLENTTFTYAMVEPPARSVADLVASSTTVGPARVTLSLEFPRGRVTADFASAVMGLFVDACKTLSSPESMHQPVLPPACEYESAAPRVLLERRASMAAEPQPMLGSLPRDHRRTLRDFLVCTWGDVLYPTGLGMESEELESSRFFDIAGSVLPAYLLAGRLNHGLRKLPIDGLDAVRVTPEDVIKHPTLLAQAALLVRRTHEPGALSSLPRRRTVVVPSPCPPSPKTGDGAGRSHRRHRDDSGGSRDPGSRDPGSPRPSGWMRHRVSLTREHFKMPAMQRSARRDVLVNMRDTIGRSSEPVHIDTATLAADGGELSPLSPPGHDDRGHSSPIMVSPVNKPLDTRARA